MVTSVSPILFVGCVQVRVFPMPDNVPCEAVTMYGDLPPERFIVILNCESPLFFVNVSFAGTNVAASLSYGTVISRVSFFVNVGFVESVTVIF